MRAASKEKWLELHGGSHWAIFYTDYANTLQKRFFDHYLKGEKNDWPSQPTVQLNVRYPGEKFVIRHENEWPLARTQWTKFYLDPADMTLAATPAATSATRDYDALGQGLTFLMPPQTEDIEITGPMAAKLFVSSSTRDADLFLIVRLFDPAGRKELTFIGSTDPNTPIANGWLRASHRRARPAEQQCPTGRIIRTTASSRSRPARCTSATSRS